MIAELPAPRSPDSRRDRGEAGFQSLVGLDLLRRTGVSPMGPRHARVGLRTSRLLPFQSATIEFWRHAFQRDRDLGNPNVCEIQSFGFVATTAVDINNVKTPSRGYFV